MPTSKIDISTSFWMCFLNKYSVCKSPSSSLSLLPFHLLWTIQDTRALILNDLPFLLQGRRYELVATITHHGRDPSKGHYTADSRHPNGKWLHFDDASVTVIPTSKVLHEQAYVLFYKQL